MNHPFAPGTLATSPRAWWRIAVLPLLILGGIASLGCGSEQVMTDYGSRRSVEQSLNGVDVLAGMFRQAGHRVRSWGFLSPALEKADVIVWFPDDLEPPSPDVQNWLDQWLRSGEFNSPPRTLIYVGRDYDSSLLYWQSVQGRAPAVMQGEYRRRLATAQAELNNRRNRNFASTECDNWFSIEPDTQSVPVAALSGPWAKGINDSKVTIERGHRLIPAEGATMLLGDEQGNSIASELPIETYLGYHSPGAQLVLVENGSWLLNAALANHEHRKLAGRLVDHVGPPRLDVVFLHSDDGGPPIRDKDPSGGPPTGFRLFQIWPIGAVLTQAALLGVLFAVMCWPIFGTPRRLVRRSLTDFGSHITALGELLHQTRDRRYAVQALRLYWKSLDRKTGAAPQSAPAEAPPSTAGPTAL